MGSFNVACSVSNLSLSPGDPVAYIPLQEDRFSNKIGDGNNMLIYLHCFYVPVTLPIFGEYDDYGRIDVTRDKNVEMLEGHYDCKIEDICDCKVKPISSGMFIHGRIYNRMVKTNIDEFGKRRGFFVLDRAKLRKEYDSFRKKYVENRDREDGFNRKESDAFVRLMQSDLLSSSTFGFRDYPTFQETYLPRIVDGRFEDELIDFIRFESAMYGMNVFYFPAMNGSQCGNEYMSRVLYKEALAITEKRIKEKEEDEEREAKWEKKHA